MAMNDERPDDDREPEFDGDDARPDEETGRPAVPVALAATESPILLHAELVEDERTPEGMVCMGTFRGDQLIARCVLSPEAWDEIEEAGVFEEPVPVVLVAQEAPPGLQCRLFAMIPLTDLTDEDDEEGEEAEPWAASVPSSRYEEAVAEDEEDDDEPRIVPLPLGNIVRYDRDRKFPDSLPREAVDILQKVIQGRTTEVVDRALADLLGSE